MYQNLPEGSGAEMHPSQFLINVDHQIIHQWSKVIIIFINPWQRVETDDVYLQIRRFFFHFFCFICGSLSHDNCSYYSTNTHGISPLIFGLILSFLLMSNDEDGMSFCREGWIGFLAKECNLLNIYEYQFAIHMYESSLIISH